LYESYKSEKVLRYTRIVAVIIAISVISVLSAFMIIVISAGDMRCGLYRQGHSDQGYDDGFGPKAKEFPDLSYLIFDLRYSWYTV